MERPRPAQLCQDSLTRSQFRGLKNHLPHVKLPQPIAAMLLVPATLPRREASSTCGEVREWPNRAVSKTAVLATGPWVRSPPSPPKHRRIHPRHFPTIPALHAARLSLGVSTIAQNRRRKS